MTDYTSPKSRIYNLAKAYADRTGKSVPAVLNRLYKAFEDLTGKRWRQAARWNSKSVLAEVAEMGRIDDLLQLARDQLHQRSATEEQEDTDEAR